ncbi:nodulation protein NfeD [Bacillus sp. 1P06AnD]
MRKWVPLFLLLLLFGVSFLPAQASASKEKVYIVPVEETVEDGLHAFLKRAIHEAEENQAEAIIFKIDTPGGSVESAWKIAKLFNETSLKTIAWVDNHALSAGAYLALNADEIYMAPNATMGAAAIIDQKGNAAGKKAESAWKAAMKAAAEQNNRDPKFALAMADENNTLDQYGAGKGKLLTLTDKQAQEVDYSKGTVKNQKELLHKLKYDQADVRYVDESFAEKVARYLTNPVVIPILLTIGCLGLVIELFSPGFGLPGLTGLTSLFLFFYGHLVAGLTGYESLVLFVIGIALILLELIIPGGVVGTLGFAAIVGSLFIAGESNTHMAISILIALVVSLAVSILMVKVFGKQMKFFRRMILTDSTNSESGYVSNINRLDLIGRTGVAVTPLRPSGIAFIDEERIDVVTEGSFIPTGSEVKIVKTEGSRIVVREIKKNEEG